MQTKMIIDISICPTALEINGDLIDEDILLPALRELIARRYPGAKIAIQVGYRQGDAWTKINGKHSDCLEEIVKADFDWTEQSLYKVWRGMQNE